MLPRRPIGYGADSLRADSPRTVGPIPKTNPDDAEALAQYAVEAARRAGAQYADARITRTFIHHYGFLGGGGVSDEEHLAVGVRVLVNGCWGFVARPRADRTDVEQMARDALAQATFNARGAPVEHVELAAVPPAVGHWSTPVAIDPFTVPIEEKLMHINYWKMVAGGAGLKIDEYNSWLDFKRQEQFVVTSDGGHFTQTLIESGGLILIRGIKDVAGLGPVLPLHNVESAGLGWEHIMDAKIPEQIQAMPDKLVARAELNRTGRPASIGRYTLVCDGATMAALVEATLGIGTQLDRILGYEANAGGTSFINDPLAMLGTFQVASPLVNVTANRSAPGQLATVKWDNEGTEPEDFRLVKNGILDDFQTTREQAMWLAPSYRGIGRPVRSNGCAASENGLTITMQHMPNLSLESATSNASLDDLVAGVQSGVLLEGGTIAQMDAQARNGLLGHNFDAVFRKITNGRVGPMLNDATVQINTLELWKNVTAIGGPSTRMMLPPPRYASMPVKGQPPQRTSHSVVAAAAVIEKQPIIDIRRKA